MFFNDQPFLAWRKPVALALGLLTLSGCAIKRDQYSVPKVLMPQRYLKSEAVLDKSQTSGLERLSATPTQSLADTLGEWSGDRQQPGLADCHLAAGTVAGAHGRDGGQCPA